jgi:hypothetical protein
MSRVHLFLLPAAALSLSCDRSLDTIAGHDLGEPSSAVFSRDHNGHVMLVLSSLESLCETLAAPDPPAQDDFWVLSAWTSVRVEEVSEYAVEAYVAISTPKQIDEFETEAGGIELSQIDGDTMRGTIDITFPGNDQIEARFEAHYCDSDLFVGMY